MKGPTIVTLLPKADVVKNKQDEIWPAPGVLQEVDTLLNCSTHHKHDRRRPKQQNQNPQSHIKSLDYKSPNGPQTIVCQNFHQATGSQFSAAVPEILWKTRPLPSWNSDHKANAKCLLPQQGQHPNSQAPGFSDSMDSTHQWPAGAPEPTAGIQLAPRRSLLSENILEIHPTKLKDIA